MDEVFDNIHSCNSKGLEDFFGLKLEMETREEKYNEKKKKMKRTWRRDIINNINDVMLFVWLKNGWREYYLYFFRYITDSHHTNKTYQEEYKEQF